MLIKLLKTNKSTSIARDALLIANSVRVFQTQIHMKKKQILIKVIAIVCD